MMNKNVRLIAAGLCAFSFSATAGASSHREAPAIALDPVADNTDVWAWVTPGTHDKLTIVATYNPLQQPAGGPNFHKFGDNVLYEIHITRGAASLEDVVTYQFRFDTEPYAVVDAGDLTKPLGGGKEFFAQLAGGKQTYSVTKVEKGKAAVLLSKNIGVAPPNIGPRTNAVAYKPPGGKYDDAFANGYLRDMGPEGRVWAGPRDDGFYVDLGGVFDLANLRAKGTAKDGVAGFNCHAITLEIPTALLMADGKAPKAGAVDDQLLGVWASASRKKVRILRADGTTDGLGPWVQVSRLGLPLVNEALIGLQDKDKYNRTTPATDVTNFGAYFLNPVIVRDAEAVGIYKALSVPEATVTALKSGRLDIIDTINLKALGHAVPLSATGDVLRISPGLDSGFPNGRPLIGGKAPNQEQADVTDVLLSVILAKGTLAISDGVDYNDKNFTTTFPYLALPWEGYTDGLGKFTP